MRIQARLIARKIARGKPADLEIAGQQLEALQGEIDRLEKLAVASLSFGRPPAAQPETIHLPDFLKQLIELIAPECESRGISTALRVSKSAQTAVVHMDRSQLEQVLLNLTRNANHAMQEGGALRITLRNQGNRCVAVGIIDSGCGIPHERLATIFEPFFSTRPDGNGLGLAIARQIVESSGGYLRVESEENRGSCFEVVLPLTTCDP
jgi:signal transduction histidine kinase